MTWHYLKPAPGEIDRVCINAESIYHVDYDADGAHWHHVSGPKLDDDTLDEIAHDMSAYDYHPSVARHWRAA